MSALDKLRGFADSYFTAHSDEWRMLMKVANEIAERYMELPLDADGEPIHIGDTCTFDGGKPAAVTGMKRYIDKPDAWMLCVGEWRYCHQLRHAEPVTAESLLEEFFGKANLPDGMQSREEMIAEFAARFEEWKAGAE